MCSSDAHPLLLTPHSSPSLLSLTPLPPSSPSLLTPHSTAVCAGLYYLRAATEERHLRAVSPEYRAYAANMDRRWADGLTWLTGVRWG